MNPHITTATTPDKVLDATLGAMTIGMVPVLGDLHDGHHALIQRSDLENDATVVALIRSGGEQTRLSDAILKMLADLGTTVVYQPDADALDLRALTTTVTVRGLVDPFEGAIRPGKIERITTVLLILINHIQPTRTYFSEMHLQNVEMLMRAHADLAMSGDIVPCPIVRDADGIPLSQFTGRLADDQRARARVVPDTLFAIQHQVMAGEVNADTLIRTGHDVLALQPDIAVEYLAIIDPATFQSVDRVEPGHRAMISAVIDGTRVLDNIWLDPGQGR